MSEWKVFYDPLRNWRDSPMRSRLVWLWRPGWDEPQLAPLDALSPAMNVNGLFFSPAVDGSGPPPTPPSQKA